MNISSTPSAALLADQGPLGAEARQDQAVLMAAKIQRQVRQEGALITQLIESAPAAPTSPPPSEDGVIGTRLSALA